MPRLLPGERDRGLTADLILDLLRRDGGAQALHPVLASATDDRHSDLGFVLSELGPHLARLPAPRRTDFRRVFGALSPKSHTWEPLERAALLARGLHEPDEDLWPLLTAALEATPETDIAPFLTRPPVPGTPLAENVAAVLRDGFPAPFNESTYTLRQWLTKAPMPWLRDLALALLGAQDDTTRRWALERLTAEAHDEALDGPLPDRAVALALDPRFSADFLADRTLTLRAAPLYRGRLARREATLAEAYAVLQALPSKPSDKPDAPPPITAPERAEFRRLRDAAIAADPTLARQYQYWLRVREPGHPEDAPLLDRLASGAQSPQEADAIVSLLVYSGDPAIEAPIARDLLARFPAPHVEIAVNFFLRRFKG